MKLVIPPHARDPYRHARGQLERDMRDCGTRRTRVLARSIMQVAARRDATRRRSRPVTAERVRRSEAGGRTCTRDGAKNGVVFLGNETEDICIAATEGPIFSRANTTTPSDAVGGKRVTRLTASLATLADSSPASRSPAIYRRPLRIHFANVVVGPTPCRRFERARAPGVVTLAGATLINGPLAMRFLRNCGDPAR